MTRRGATAFKMSRPARIARLSVAAGVAALLLAGALALHGASGDDPAAGTSARQVAAPGPQADEPELDLPARPKDEPELDLSAPPDDEPGLDLPARTALESELDLPAPSEDEAELDLPPQEEIEAHKSFDPSPKLQRTPGGSLIVDAFIMDGPVRVEIRRRDSDELLLEKQSDTLFSFEVERTTLGAAPEDVVVRIYIDDTLAHELALER